LHSNRVFTCDRVKIWPHKPCLLTHLCLMFLGWLMENATRMWLVSWLFYRYVQTTGTKSLKGSPGTASWAQLENHSKSQCEWHNNAWRFIQVLGEKKQKRRKNLL
jgi:hypothetical protein